MVRDYQPSDLPEIIALHKAQGFDYSLGDLSNPLFFVKKVRVVDGRIVAAMALRLTCETFLLVNPEDSPIVKFDSMIELQPEVLSEAELQAFRWKGKQCIVRWKPSDPNHVIAEVS